MSNEPLADCNSLARVTNEGDGSDRMPQSEDCHNGILNRPSVYQALFVALVGSRKPNASALEC